MRCQEPNVFISVVTVGGQLQDHIGQVDRHEDHPAQVPSPAQQGRHWQVVCCNMPSPPQHNESRLQTETYVC